MFCYLYAQKDSRADAILHRAAIAGDVVQCQSVLETGRVYVDCADMVSVTSQSNICDVTVRHV